MADWHPAYIGIGSNLSEPAVQVRQALTALAGLPRSRLIVSSALYGNPPMGPQDQPDYINAAAAILTQLAPLALLNELKAIETGQGRVRAPDDRWGPRIIDLDLLVYGTAVVNETQLTIPHPGIFERNFVLFPLLDIAPQLMVPGQGPVTLLAGALEDTPIERIEG